MSRILIVDDEPAICWSFRQFLGEAGHEVLTASTAEQAWELAERHRPDAVVMDVRLPRTDGITALAELRRRAGDVPVIVITAFGNLDTAVRALDAGAFDYLTKPFDVDQAVDVVTRALRERAAALRRGNPVVMPASAGEFERPAAGETGLIGRSPAMQRVFKQIALAAQSDVPVLITGESGTGKELAAVAIHRHSRRSDGPFVPLCLPALNPTLIESELFGHVRGAFTGAEVDRKGRLELAHGGTVLLDEIGEIPLSIQVKLLRAIELGEVLPVGGALPHRSDFRVIAATNRDLGQLVQGGRFREDLFYRLSVFHLHMPPLRERREDIPLLADHFLRRAERDSTARRFTDEAIRELQRRRWPGNVRQLRNVVEHAAALTRAAEIGPEMLPEEGPTARHPATGQDATGPLRETAAAWTRDWLERHDPHRTGLYADVLLELEAGVLPVVLAACGGNRAAAARRLGIHRATLREKLRRLEAAGLIGDGDAVETPEPPAS
ncbi:MAG: sigma-54-dependent Fis family transcriptional regulator [Planctomycetota bacterium]|nr:MAG: sigma-54-dependent Fis family transcriptional regulator [Planctomycetota bacterium]